MDVKARCPRCDSWFEVTKDRVKFCSLVCRQGYAQLARTCQGCGSEFSTYKSDPQVFCTRKCYNTHNPHRGSGSSVTLTCQGCGVAYQCQLSRVADSRFCSMICLGASNGRRQTAERTTSIQKPCAVCGTTIRVPPSLANRKKYCSRKCNGIAQVSSNSYWPRSSKIGDDAIVYWAEHGQFGRNLPWDPELRISRWTVDLAFPSLMLVIELDGTYWHSRPGMAEKDERKTAGLNRLGWSVHRIPIEADSDPTWLAQCIDVVVAKKAHASELSRIPAVMEAVT